MGLKVGKPPGILVNIILLALQVLAQFWLQAQQVQEVVRNMEVFRCHQWMLTPGRPISLHLQADLQKDIIIVVIRLTHPIHTALSSSAHSIVIVSTKDMRYPKCGALSCHHRPQPARYRAAVLRLLSKRLKKTKAHRRAIISF